MRSPTAQTPTTPAAPAWQPPLRTHKPAGSTHQLRCRRAAAAAASGSHDTQTAQRRCRQSALRWSAPDGLDCDRRARSPPALRALCAHSRASMDNQPTIPKSAMASTSWRAFPSSGARALGGVTGPLIHCSGTHSYRHHGLHISGCDAAPAASRRHRTARREGAGGRGRCEFAVGQTTHTLVPTSGPRDRPGAGRRRCMTGRVTQHAGRGVRVVACARRAHCGRRRAQSERLSRPCCCVPPC